VEGTVGRKRLAWLLAIGLLACNADETQIYDVRGVVRGVQRAERQLVVQHEDIEGLMPAMTMNFGVVRPELLDGVEPGQVIAFKLAASRRGYYIVELEVIATDETGAVGDSLEGLVDEADPAPPFRLIDQQGSPVALSDLSGRALLLDFVFTRCPGPCPVLTGLHVDVQRALPEELRERTWFVSISLDPEHDRPEALRAYAEARGVDLSSWSFLTGESGAVDEVIRSYGVGKVLTEEGEIEHTVATFVIDPQGQIVHRFLGLDHSPDEIVRALRRAAG
jgi:protein SCO1/2